MTKFKIMFAFLFASLLSFNVWAMSIEEYCTKHPCLTTYSSEKHHYANHHLYKKHSIKSNKNTGGGFAAVRAATGKRVFIFDPSIRRYGVYDESGKLVTTGRASGGRGYCPDIHRACRTPVGTFQIHAKKGGDCKSSRFPVGKGGAPMPFCMFFKNNFAVHGSYEVRDYNASHGCIRIAPSEAEWLNHNFLKIGSTVIVRPY